MFLPPSHAPPARNGKGPFVITWQHDIGPYDETECCRAEFPTQAEAREALAWIETDLAAGGIRCNWLDPDFDEIPF